MGFVVCVWSVLFLSLYAVVCEFAFVYRYRLVVFPMYESILRYLWSLFFAVIFLIS